MWRRCSNLRNCWNRLDCALGLGWISSWSTFLFFLLLQVLITQGRKLLGRSWMRRREQLTQPTQQQTMLTLEQLQLALAMTSTTKLMLNILIKMLPVLMIPLTQLLAGRDWSPRSRRSCVIKWSLVWKIQVRIEVPCKCPRFRRACIKCTNLNSFWWQLREYICVCLGFVAREICSQHWRSTY